MARFLCVSRVQRCAERFDDLAVLVVRKADRTVVRPLPCFVGRNGFPCAVRIDDLQLHEQLRLRAVLVFASPRAAAAAIPSVGKLHGQLVFTCVQQFRHVVGLILHALPIVRIPRRKAEIADPFSVEPRFIEPARRGVQPRGCHRLFNRNELSEAVDRIAFLPVRNVIARDPLCRKVGR